MHKRGLCRHAVSDFPSRSWILSKRIDISSNFFSPSDRPTIPVFHTKHHGNIPTGTSPNGGVVGLAKSRFSMTGGVRTTATVHRGVYHTDRHASVTFFITTSTEHGRPHTTIRTERDSQRSDLNVRSGKSEAEVTRPLITEDCARRIVLLKPTTNRRSDIARDGMGIGRAMHCVVQQKLQKEEITQKRIFV